MSRRASSDSEGFGSGASLRGASPVSLWLSVSCADHQPGRRRPRATQEGARCRLQHGVNEAELRGRLYLASRESDGKLMVLDEKGRPVAGPWP